MNESIDFSKVIRAKETFERFRYDMKDDRDRAGAVYAYKFCCELAWKLMKRILAARGLETGSPKDTFRKAALEKLIDDPELWCTFQQKRNISSYTYDEEDVMEVIDIFDSFSKEVESLLKRAKEMQ